MTVPLLSVEAVGKRFGAVRALHDVTFSVEKGEIVGLIGPNGSGKTTLIGSIAGIHRLDTGIIRLDGTSVHKLPPHRRRRLGIAQTFQVVRPLSGMSVLENAMVSAIFARPGAPREHSVSKARHVLEAVGLGEVASSAVDILPVQDLKRLELARALAADPALVLLDEVMAGLGDTALDDIGALIRSVAAEGRGVLMSEHRVRSLFSLVDRIVVLQEGSKIAEGTPREIASHPTVISAYLGHGYSTKLLGGGT